jgi:hypothetical protein
MYEDVYSDPNLSIERPDVMDLPSVDPEGKIDPLNCEIEGVDGPFLKGVYLEYLRPKWKAVLRNWYKETGGGPSTLENFINYCNEGKSNATYPFLVWMYVIDCESAGLLSSNSEELDNTIIALDEGEEG